MRLGPVWTRLRSKPARTKNVYAREAILAHLEDWRIIIFQQKLLHAFAVVMKQSSQREEVTWSGRLNYSDRALKSLRKVDKPERTTDCGFYEFTRTVAADPRQSEAAQR